MDDILKWATQNSPPILVLISLVAALLYVVKAAVDQSVSAGFNRYAKEVELRLQRRSNFEERVLLDRYTAIRDLQLRLEKIMTELNRRRHGEEVAGLVENGEVVRLTEAFELLNVNKMLLTQKFYNLLLSKAQLALEFANTREPADLNTLFERHAELDRQLLLEMNNDFGLDRISWVNSGR